METSTILSITLTATVSALSLIVSILTVLLNNRHQKQIKILDIVYDKKYKTYQEFFEIYAKYRLTKEFDKTVLSRVITNCLLVSNNNTTQSLESLLRKITDNKNNSEQIKKEFRFMLGIQDQCFRNCIKFMKEELKLS